MRKIGAILLCLSLFLTMAGCGEKDTAISVSTHSASDVEAVSSVETGTAEEGGLDATGILEDAKAFLTGDLTSNEAQQLMQGNLDAIFRNVISSEYCQMVGSTEEELIGEYYDGLDIEAGVFEQYFGIEYDTESIRSQIVDFYDQVYPKCDYTLGEVTRDVRAALWQR